MLIYKITNKASGRTYVGQTRQSLSKRIAGHIHSHSLLIDQAIFDEGADAFDFELIEECNSIEQLNERERYWISELGTLYPDGYNRKPGGGGSAYRRQVYTSTGRLCTYPAVFTVNDDHSFTVQFCDVSNAITEGKTMAEAVEMAQEALGMMLCMLEDEGKPFPAPSPLDSIKLENNQLLRPITVDVAACRRMLDDIDNNPIRYAREQVGMNIKELADYLGAPYRTVQDWNSGNSRPPRWMERILFNHIMNAK